MKEEEKKQLVEICVDALKHANDPLILELQQHKDDDKATFEVIQATGTRHEVKMDAIEKKIDYQAVKIEDLRNGQTQINTILMKVLDPLVDDTKRNTRYVNYIIGGLILINIALGLYAAHMK